MIANIFQCYYWIPVLENHAQCTLHVPIFLILIEISFILYVIYFGEVREKNRLSKDIKMHFFIKYKDYTN